MAKYKILAMGWECHFQSVSIDDDQVEEAEELNDVWDIEEEFLGGGGEGDYETSNLWFNDSLHFQILDENNNELESFDYKDADLLTVGEVVEDDDIGYKCIGVDPTYEESYENTLVLIHEYKGSVMEFTVESDTVPTKGDISTATLCIESPDGDYDLLDTIAFRGELLEHDDFDGGNGKASYVKIYTKTGETIEIE